MAGGAAANGGSASADEEKNCQSRGKEVGPSLNSLALMRRAIKPDISSADIKDWLRVVHEGVIIRNELDTSGKSLMKFWVDEKLHKNCFLVLPYDNWFGKTINVKERCSVDVAVVKCVREASFSMGVIFHTRLLSPNTTYEVAHVVKLSRKGNNGPLPVYVTLNLADGPPKGHRENLERKPKGTWINLQAGEFRMGPKTLGLTESGIGGYFSGREGAAFIYKGALIIPKD